MNNQFYNDIDNINTSKSLRQKSYQTYNEITMEKEKQLKGIIISFIIFILGITVGAGLALILYY